MMKLAKQTLNDLRVAIDLLNETDDEQLFRILLVSAVSMNRTIGWILENDGDDAVRQASNLLYKEWKSDKDCIFNTFINDYRNVVLHEARTGVETNIPVVMLDAEQNPIMDEIDLGDLIYTPISTFKDKHSKRFEYGDLDVRDLLEESFIWWCKQIARIEEMLGTN